MLELTAQELQARIAAGDLPSTLQEVEISDGQANPDVVEALLEHWGVPFTPRIEREWQQELPAD